MHLPWVFHNETYHVGVSEAAVALARAECHGKQLLVFAGDCQVADEADDQNR